MLDLLLRTFSLTGAYPEIAQTDGDGEPAVHFIYELDIHAAQAERIPRNYSPFGYRAGINPREITELGFQWFIVQSNQYDGPVGGNFAGVAVRPRRAWHPDTQEWSSISYLLDWRYGTDDEQWTRAAQPISVSTSAGDGTARIVVPASMLPPGRSCQIAVRSRFAIDKPRQFDDLTGSSDLQIVGNISENVAPTLLLSSPARPTVPSPLTISGYAVDTDLHGSGVSGIHSIEYSIIDVGQDPHQGFDFETQQWTDTEVARSKKLETSDPFFGPPGVTFTDTWTNPNSRSSSNEFELVVRALDGSGNASSVNHRFEFDDDDPQIRFEAPRQRQIVTGDVIAIDGVIEDASEITSVRMSVASNNTGEYLDASRNWVSGAVTFEPTITESNGVTTFNWTWARRSEEEYFSVFVEAEDAAGNSSRSRLRFGSKPTDAEPPLAQIMSPRAHTTHYGTVRIRGRAYDNVDLADVRVEVWSVGGNSEAMSRFVDQPVSVSGATQWQYFDTTVNLSQVIAMGGPGNYLLSAVAIDVSGHETRDLRLITVN